MTIFLLIVNFILTGLVIGLLRALFKRSENHEQILVSLTEGQQVLRSNQTTLNVSIKQLNTEIQNAKKTISKKEVGRRNIK